MQAFNNKKDARYNLPEWCFLAEYPLTKLMVEMDNPGNIESEELARIMRELGVEAELFSQIERRIIELSKQAMAQFDQGRYAAPTIRLFFKWKAVEEISSQGPTCPLHEMDTPKTPAASEQPDQDTNGGWGYFVIERGEKNPHAGGARPHIWIDLFLYREGI